jgi:peroxiredoxin
VIAVGSAAPALRGQPVFGLPFDLEARRQRGAMAVIFMAPLLAGVSQRNLAALTAIWPRIDAEAGGMVLVSRSPLETARDFVPRHHVLFPMLVDSTGEMAAAWGVGKATGLASRLARARPGFVRDALSVWRNGQPPSWCPGKVWSPTPGAQRRLGTASTRRPCGRPCEAEPPVAASSRLR